MKEHRSVVTRKGQITIPAKITAPCGKVAPPIIDSIWGCLLRGPAEGYRGHCQARVRLSKAYLGHHRNPL